jgi:hypothetical protein
VRVSVRFAAVIYATDSRTDGSSGLNARDLHTEYKEEYNAITDEQKKELVAR